MDKAGCGTYRYPSKARYEGEWQDNTKEGFGIYYYPKGGLYKVPFHRSVLASDWRQNDGGAAEHVPDAHAFQQASAST
jgi:MORN repeat